MNVSMLCLLMFVCLTCGSPRAGAVDDPFSNKRDGSQDATIQVALENGHLEHGVGAYYFFTVDLGSPPQPMKLLIDTGSSDFWVYGSNFCGQVGGCFNETKSTTASSTDLPPFFGEYGGGDHISEMNGTFITDNVSVAGVKLKDVTLAIIDKTNDTKKGFGGLLGLSWDHSEAQHIGSTIKYPNMVDLLYSEGYIQSHTYSLHLDDIDSGSGSIFFGEYDTAKYTGPQIPLTAGKSSLLVPLQAVWITDASGATSEAGFYANTVLATLDSGTPFTASLPDGTYNMIVNHIEGLGYAITDSNAVNPHVDCGLRNAEGSIDLTFTDINGSKATNLYFNNTITIVVPFSELAVSMLGGSGAIEYCFFGISSAGSGDSVFFGDTFMRSMYIVFASDFDVIALAQPRFNATGSDIVPVVYPPKAGRML